MFQLGTSKLPLELWQMGFSSTTCDILIPRDVESSTIENLNTASNPMKLIFHFKFIHIFLNEPITKSRSLLKPSESLLFRHFWRQSIHIKHRIFPLQKQLPKFPRLSRSFIESVFENEFYFAMFFFFDDHALSGGRLGIWPNFGQNSYCEKNEFWRCLQAKYWYFWTSKSFWNESISFLKLRISKNKRW